MISDIERADFGRALFEQPVIVRTDSVVKFAGGDKANTKFEWEVIEKDTPVFDRAVDLLCELLEPMKPDCIFPVPDGFNEAGDEIAERLGIPSFHATKVDSNTRDITVSSKVKQRLVKLGLSRPVAGDDAFTKGSSLRRLHSAVPGGLIGAAVVLDRSDPSQKLREQMPFQTEAIVHKHIPFFT